MKPAPPVINIVPIGESPYAFGVESRILQGSPGGFTPGRARLARVR